MPETGISAGWKAAVTLHAAANQEIQEAKIDLNCAGLRDLRMSPAGKTASGRFTLSLNPENPAEPLYNCYQLLFTDREGRRGRRPVRYQIDVVRDLPPEVEIASPREEDAGVAVDGQMEIRVAAEDPDFALRHVALNFEGDGHRLAAPPLLDRPVPDKPWQGRFEARYLFRPTQFGLKVGDRVKYWAERWTTRNRRPTARRPARGRSTSWPRSSPESSPRRPIGIAARQPSRQTAGR